MGGLQGSGVGFRFPGFVRAHGIIGLFQVAPGVGINYL